MIKKGEIVQVGTYEQLLNQPGEFAQFIQQYLTDQAIAEEDSTYTDVIDGPTSEDRVSSLRDRLRRRKQSEVQPIEPRKKTNVHVNKPGINKAGEKLIVKEKIETGKVKKSVFTTYFKACGYLVSVIAISNFVIVAGCMILPNIWLSEWSNDDANQNVTESRVYRLGVFAGLSILQCIASLCKYFNKNV